MVLHPGHGMLDPSRSTMQSSNIGRRRDEEMQKNRVIGDKRVLVAPTYSKDSLFKVDTW